MSTNKLFIFGLHAVESLLAKQPERVIQLYVQKERQDQKIQAVIELAESERIPIAEASRHELDRMTGNEVHQGVVAACHKPKSYSENDLENIISEHKRPFFLILDGIQDPHNLGACLRSADAAGVHAVITPKDKSVGITPTVSKVACGAAEVVPFVQVTNLARTMRSLKEQGVWMFGAAGEADKSLYQADLNLPLALVLGAEGQGLRRLTREHCDMLLNIPMQGSVSSLNVSVATGIFLFEAVRQRGI
ncbi:MAG: 23S rRNA (guanosine(2251)-2'-O)-methyltransferase RlmB [Gammaproteobacteria bacterium]|nr:23S rRNA (guanosine(2251)-2'-O)-methyltransferase RlmB [Gammaproteobacteria bacterium]